jgi:hypothetical protein
MEKSEMGRHKMGRHKVDDCYFPDAKPGKKVVLRNFRFGLLGGGCLRGWFAVGFTPDGAL